MVVVLFSVPAMPLQPLTGLIRPGLVESAPSMPAAAVTFVLLIVSDPVPLVVVARTP